jgi:hypothetical protein
MPDYIRSSKKKKSNTKTTNNPINKQANELKIHETMLAKKEM